MTQTTNQQTSYRLPVTHHAIKLCFYYYLFLEYLYFSPKNGYDRRRRADNNNNLKLFSYQMYLIFIDEIICDPDYIYTSHRVHSTHYTLIH